MSTTNENNRKEERIQPKHASELVQKWQLLLSAGENGGGGLCDVVLIAGKNKQRVPAHRVILATNSPYFEAMFTGHMRESSASEVTLGNDVHGDFLLPLVKFCYTGEIEICADTVDKLVQTASRLQLDDVVSACSAFMKRRLDASNCLGVAALAELLNLGDLKESADKYACKHFLQVSQHEEFLKLSFDRFKVLIASDDLNVRTEEAVLHSVMSWLRYDAEDEEGKRFRHTPALLALVRLSHLPVTLLIEHVWDICNKHACMPLFQEAFEEANVPTRSRRIRPRISMQPSLLALWLDKGRHKLRFAEYSTEKDKWTLLHKTISYRIYFGAAILNNELIVAGGLVMRFTGYLCIDTVESINLDTMTSTQMPSMAQKRSNFGIAVLDGLLYAAGGAYDDDVKLNRVERYDPNDRKWCEVAPMSVARVAFGLAALNGRLFAVSGLDINWDPLNSTECYDPQTDKWTQLANLNIPRSSFSIANGKGFLYAVGGCDGNELLQSIELYDPLADNWTEISSLKSPQECVRSVFLDDRLLVLTYDTDSILFEEYNLKTETWTERAMLDESVYHLHAFLK